jgi:hypothetical protein
MRRREFITLLGGAALRAQLSTGGNVTVKRLDKKLSAGYHARLNVRVLRARWIGGRTSNKQLGEHQWTGRSFFEHSSDLAALSCWLPASSPRK